MKFLEGNVVVVDTVDEEVGRLRREIHDLRADLALARQEAQVAKQQSARAVGELRRQLSPLYRALQAVFGEMEASGFVDAPAASASPRVSAVWESWKSKLPGYPAKTIEALLLHTEMSTQQLAIAVGCRKERIYEAIVKLNKAGLLNKNGGRFSLKAL